MLQEAVGIERALGHRFVVAKTGGRCACYLSSSLADERRLSDERSHTRRRGGQQEGQPLRFVSVLPMSLPWRAPIDLIWKGTAKKVVILIQIFLLDLFKGLWVLRSVFSEDRSMQL